MVVAALALLATGCSSSDEPPAARPSSTPSPTPAGPTNLTFAVYGPPPVITAYTKIAADYTAEHPGTVVNVQPYDTHDEAMTALTQARARGEAPDLFLMNNQDLASLDGDGDLRRVDDLLAEREVDFGDGYYRNGLEAFSAESALKCMPVDVSPMVVYYNPRLIDLSRVAEPGRNPVSAEDGWSMDEFRAAALQARGPGVRGLYVAPELEQVAPFVWSGGGEIVDDQDDPTTLTLAEDGSTQAMQQLLETVRDPALTFNEKALQRRSALERFKAGKLGMMLGFRDLTPVLRQQQDLLFDVMPMPKLSAGATVASMEGLCISGDSDHIKAAADFLARVISDASAEALAATGYVMPANLDVVNSEAFRQTGQNPLHSEVFTKKVRDSRPMPRSAHWGEVRAQAALLLRALFYQPVIEPLDERLTAIDEASKALLKPEESPSAGSSPSTSGSPSSSTSP